MAAKRKSGLPRALEPEDDPHEPTMEQFIQEMHGQADVPQNGMPPLTQLKEQYKTKSAAIRYLVHEGFEIKAIAKHLGVRYQMVRNVATNPLKRGPNEDWRPKPKDEPTK
jgi:hypothetical protein